MTELTSSLSNKEILFLFTLIKDYCSSMSEERSEAKRKQGLVRAIAEFTDDTPEKRREFVDMTDKMTESAVDLLSQRIDIAMPILQKLEIAYDMIAEAQPELLDEINEIVKGEGVKAEFDEMLNDLQNGE